MQPEEITNKKLKFEIFNKKLKFEILIPSKYSTTVNQSELSVTHTIAKMTLSKKHKFTQLQN